MPSDKKPPEAEAGGTLDLFAARPARPAPAPVVAAPPPSVAVQQAPAAPQQQQAPERPEPPRVYRVVEIVRLAGRALEARFPDVWVEGEISNLKVVSGHAYFTLKDGEAQLPAVMFRAAAQRIRFRATDGLKVRARGRLSIYEAGGKFQLYVEALEPAGLGALQLALEQLKRKLQAEGLFEEKRKRPLPFLPRRIGVATSATGAAVRDILRVAAMRGPARIVVAPCLVQGEEAPADIVRALAALQRQPEVDLIIVGRGGGSIEDLWAFNDERVARAIAACRVPVISAVGHEVDFTIADFVADRRAATPSQAAEIAVPVHAELVRQVSELRARLARAGGRAVDDARLRLDDATEEAGALASRAIERERRRLQQLDVRLGALHPSARLARGRKLLDPLARRRDAAMQQALQRGRKELLALGRRLEAASARDLADRRRVFESLLARLDALSPLRVLERGYGLVRGPSGQVVTRAGELHPGDRVHVRLARGAIAARVEEVDEGEPSA